VVVTSGHWSVLSRLVTSVVWGLTNPIDSK